jgi:hypothetical protein
MSCKQNNLENNTKCKIIQSPVLLPQSDRFSNQLKSNTYKTVYQGQPSNITINHVLSDTATITFTIIGIPVSCFVILTPAIGQSTTFTVFGVTECIAEGLLPNTNYVVNVIANYISGQQFPVNTTKSFHTLDKWKVPSVTPFYPQNRELVITENFNYVPIDLSFDFSTGSPSQYVIKVDETGFFQEIPNSYMKIHHLYQIYIRNDSTSTVNVITEYYNDRNYSDISFTHAVIWPAFFEGTSTFQLFVNDTQSIDISYSKAPGSPIYSYYISENDTDTDVAVFQKYTMDDGNSSSSSSLREIIQNLKLNTNYTIYVETYYASTTKNTYTNGNRQTCTTLNQSSIRNVNCLSTPTSLLFTFDNPIGDFTTNNNSYLSIRLTDDTGTDVSFISMVVPNTISMKYTDLSANEEYTWKVISYYGDIFYNFERTYRTLYEGIVNNVYVSNVKGTSVDISFSAFSASNSITPSKPDYYIINYTDTSNNTNAFNTYLTVNSLQNVLEPVTTYTFDVTAVYSSSNRYSLYRCGSATTINEGSFKTLDVDKLKGDLVHFEWTLYPGVTYPDSLKMNIYLYMTLVKTVDISYNSLGRLVPDPIIDGSLNILYESDYSFHFISVFPDTGNVYERIMNITTLNEYPVQIDPVIIRAESITVSKKDFNNHDEYFLIRNQSDSDTTTYTWSVQTVSTGDKFFAGPKVEFFSIEMCKNSEYAFYSQNDYEIQIFRKQKTYNRLGLDVGLVYKKMDTITFSKNIVSISVNYNGSVFIVGFDDLCIDVYDISNGTSYVKRRIITVNGTTSRNVVLSPAGNICAASNCKVHDSIFIMDLSTNEYFNYVISNLTVPDGNWFTSVLNKYIQFDEFGDMMIVGFELFYYYLNMTGGSDTSSVKTSSVKVLDKDSNSFSYSSSTRYNDVSGGRISLNKAGTKLAVVNNYDISSNGNTTGSVSLYDVLYSGLVTNHTFWCTDDVSYSIYRNCSVNDIGDVVAISEYNFSYKYNLPPTSDGQVLVYELSGNIVWVSRGDPIRLSLEDVPPFIIDDTTLPGEWFGFKLLLDASGTIVLTSTMSKLNMKVGYRQGKGFIYNWRSDIEYQYNIENWPVVLENLVPGISYSFTIYSAYKEDLTYNYPLSIIATTLQGQSPDVSYTISSNRINVTWHNTPPPDEINTVSLYYNVVVNTLNDGLLISDANFVHFPDSIDTTSELNSYSYPITGLTYDTLYYIKVASKYGIPNSSVPIEYASEGILTTLAERASDISGFVKLNSDHLVVLRIENENENDVSENVISLNISHGTLYNYNQSVVLTSSNLVDLSSVNAGDLIEGYIYTTYKKMEDGLYSYKNGSYTSDRFSFTVSYEMVPDKLVTSGMFYHTYSSLISHRNRWPIDILKGLWRVIPPSWDTYSNYVFVIENKIKSDISNQVYLNITDVSYHAFLYRSEDIFPLQNVNASNLTQSLKGIMFSQMYNNSFYLRNQDESINVYNSQTQTYFSDIIRYKIEFSESDVSDNDVIFYETSPLTNSGTAWEKINLNVKFPISRENIKYTIRRLDQEYNNLFISDVSMVRIRPENDVSTTLTPFWDFSGAEWSNLSSTSVNWTDTWQEDVLGHRNLKLSCNMSISIWCYLHYTDTSLCIFLLGTDLNNGTPCIYVDNNANIIVQNIYDDPSSPTSHATVSTNLSLNGVPTHFVVTYFNNTIITYVNGRSVNTVDLSSNKIRESSVDYKIYLGNPNSADISYGAVLKSVELYDYKLESSAIYDLYSTNDMLKIGIGNPNDLSANIISSFSTADQPYNYPVSQNVLGKRTLYKNIASSESFMSHLTDVSCVSMWTNASSIIYINDVSCSYTDNKLQFLNYEIPFANSNNHVAMTFSEANNMKLYINGYFYLSDFTEITCISGTNLGEVVLWNKILSESELITAYYNYYNLYSLYNLSGGAYTFYVKYPNPSISYDISYVLSSTVSRDISVNNLSGVINIIAGDEYSGYITTGIDLEMDELTRNVFNKNPYTIHVNLPEYDVNHDMSGLIAPYITYNYSHIQYLNEQITLNFWLENSSSDISYTYEISGEISGQDLSNSSSMIGYITDSSNKVTIELKADHIMETMESLIFTVPYLGIATSLEIYDSIYFTSTSRYVVEHDVFTISLRNSLRSNSRLYYEISGVDPSDIGFADLSGYFIFNSSNQSNLSTVDVSLSVCDISFVVTAEATVSTDKEFEITLTDDDLSYVSIKVLLNDYFVVSTNTYDISAGDNFTVHLKTPHYIIDGTSFQFAITNHSNNNVIGLPDFSGALLSLSGDLLCVDSSASAIFYMAYTTEVYDTKLFTFTISGVSDNPNAKYYSFSKSVDISVNSVLPIFDLSGPVFVKEDTSFNLYLTDVTQKLPDESYVSFSVIGLTDSLYQIDDLSWNNTKFVFYNHVAVLQGIVVGHNTTTGNKPFNLSIDNYPQNSLNMEIVNTSLSPLYNLSASKTTVNEGDSFTVTLSYSNRPDGKVPFVISGTNISAVDFDGTVVFNDFFIIPSVLTKTYVIHESNITRAAKKINFRLENAPAISIDISINATQGPFYNLQVLGPSLSPINQETDSFNRLSKITLILSTIDVAIGSEVTIQIFNVSEGDLTFDRSIPYETTTKCYKLLFTIGYNNNTITFINNVKTTKTINLTCGLPLVYVNYDSTNVKTLKTSSGIMLKS